jgi:O-antigen/teichoic acid export membrane protein
LNLQQRIRRGFAFVFLSTAGSRGLSFAAQIVLLRLLEPADFGALAFGLLVVNTLGLLHSMGIGEALIFRKEADQQSSDTGLILGVVMGLALYGLIYATAPWIALLDKEPESSPIVQVMRLLGLVVIIQALAGVPNALLERELEFKKKFYINTLETLVFAVLAVGLALYGHGVWSLVWGQLGGALASCAAAWWLVPWRPRWQFSWSAAREVIGYGRFVSGAGLVSFLVVNVDDALILRLGGREMMGFYTRAYQLTNLPVTSITHIVNRVAFPAYARLKDEGRETNPLYVRLLRGTALLTLPAAIGLACLAEPFILGVLGGKWAPLIPLLPWLALYGFLRSLLSNTGPLFSAMGVPEAILKINLVQLGILALVLYPLIYWNGAWGACIGILLGTLLSAPLALKYLNEVAGLDLRSQLEVLRPMWWPGLSMGIALLGARYAFAAWAPEGQLVELFVVGGFGVLVYGGMLYYREKRLVEEMLALLKGQVND